MGQSICGCAKPKEKHLAPIKLAEKEILFLIENTIYDRAEIDEWYAQFLVKLVIVLNFLIKNNSFI